LVQTFQQTMAALPPGNARVRALEHLVVQMRAAWPAARTAFEEFRRGQQAAQRLAAIVYLQDAPNQTYIDWLAQRVDQEQPFVGYQAIIALESAGAAIGDGAGDAIRQALLRVLSILETRQLRRSDRYRRARSALGMTESEI
jgi:hypothetical protein